MLEGSANKTWHVACLLTGMQILSTNLGETKVLKLSGRLDAESANSLEDRCHALITQGSQSLLLDFTSLEYLSSAGLRSILVVGKALKAVDGKLVLVSGQGQIRQILQAAGYDKLFPVCDSLDQAGKHTTGNFRLVLSKEWDVDIISLYGRLDAEHAPELEAAGKRILETGYLKLIISLTGLQYLSSAGLCALLNLAKLANVRHCRLFICDPVPTVRQILQISGFDKLIPIRATIAETLVE
jgi:anti-anti-sigma factor